MVFADLPLINEIYINKSYDFTQDHILRNLQSIDRTMIVIIRDKVRYNGICEG